MQDEEKQSEFLGQLPGFENVYKVLPCAVKQVLNMCQRMLSSPSLASCDRLVNPWVLPAEELCPDAPGSLPDCVFTGEPAPALTFTGGVCNPVHYCKDLVYLTRKGGD